MRQRSIEACTGGAEVDELGPVGVDLQRADVAALGLQDATGQLAGGADPLDDAAVVGAAVDAVGSLRHDRPGAGRAPVALDRPRTSAGAPVRTSIASMRCSPMVTSRPSDPASSATSRTTASHGSCAGAVRCGPSGVRRRRTTRRTASHRRRRRSPDEPVRLALAIGGPGMCASTFPCTSNSISSPVWCPSTTATVRPSGLRASPPIWVGSMTGAISRAPVVRSKVERVTHGLCATVDAGRSALMPPCLTA